MSEGQYNEFEFESSILVLRMFDETKARAFYLEFLGYAVDWEHRFRPETPDSPLYMQISQGASVLHLNGHASEETPAAEVRIPVQRLEAYCEWLCARAPGYERPEIVDPRGEGRRADMNIHDPSGNLLVFWSRAADG